MKLPEINIEVISEYFETDRSHPKIDPNNSNNSLIISLFHCPPFVIYLDKNNLKFDGLEIRLLHEITRKWNLTYLVRDQSKEIPDPWVQVLYDIEIGKSNVAICSIWINFHHKIKFDLATYHEYQCETFLVPRPKLLHTGSVIYLSISEWAWLTFILCFLLTGLLLSILTKFGIKIKKDKWSDYIFKDLNRSYLEAINTATSHAVENFPQQTSIKLLLFSWMIMSFLFGVGYTTGYTSLLTMPRFSMPIDTISQFLENGFYWGTPSNTTELLKNMELSEVDKYSKLANTYTIIDSDINNVRKHINTGKYAVSASVVADKYISTRDTKLFNITYYRVMKSCIFNYYLTLAFNKHSPYTVLFDTQIRSYHESGFIQYWHSELYDQYHLSQKVSPDDNYKFRNNNDPNSLNFTNVIGAFYILFFGYILSFIVFVFEIGKLKMLL